MKEWAIAVTLTLFVSVVSSDNEGIVNATAWRSYDTSSSSYNPFPEQSLSSVMSRPNTGIAFSGGGGRSFLLSLGYLSGLQEIGLLDKVRYVTGISGGSWASLVFTFAKTNNLTEFLGPIPAPEDLTLKNLKELSDNCGRSLPVRNNFNDAAVANFLNPKVNSRDFWIKTVEDVYFSEFELNGNKMMAYDTNHVNDIIQRNPGMKWLQSDFITPRNNTPFVIVGTTVLTPLSTSPIQLKNRTYTLREYTALYCGQPKIQNVTYHGKHSTMTVERGGFIESHVCDSAGATSGIPHDAINASLQVKQPQTIASPAVAAGLSSWVAGDYLAWLTNLTSDYDVIRPLWSPVSNQPQSIVTAVGDGGLSTNLDLMALLQRKVKNIVVFANTEIVLNTTYNPLERPPHSDDLDDTYPSFFGLDPDKPENQGWDYSRNQVFAKEDFPKFMNLLLTSQRNGKGAIAEMELCTVENAWWGIEAGFCANITWVYLSRAPAWEARLPHETQVKVIPAKDPSNPSNTINHGDFKGFPNVDDSEQHFKSDLANLLSDVSGWIIKENEDIFKRTLTP